MIHCSDITVATPTKDSVDRDYAAINAALDRGSCTGALAMRETVERAYATWDELISFRYDQDMRVPASRAANTYACEIGSVKSVHSVALKQRLLKNKDRNGLEALIGAHAVRLWEINAKAYKPVTIDNLPSQSGLKDRYRTLIGGGKVVFEGQKMNLRDLAPYAQSPDRTIRYKADQAYWGFFEKNGEEIDEILDGLVKVRNAIADKQGCKNYIELAYLLNTRIGYDAKDIEDYRKEAASHIVPFVGRILDKRQAAFGWDHLYAWDAGIIDPQGNPKPVGDPDALIAAAKTMYRNMDPCLADLFETMEKGGYLDLKPREGKASSAYCGSFPSLGMPYIFGNMNGTHSDIALLVHEFGHSFQMWSSRHQPVFECRQASSEAGEIPSKGLEYLTYPFINAMLAPGEADRYRRIHLSNAICSLPSVLLVDHFQHDLYANPSASAADRNEMWRMREKQYMPRLDYGDLNYPASGARWQSQRHIINSPFYYIDYMMAEGCGLQLLQQSRIDYRGTMEAFVGLCQRGGEAPALDLMRDAGFRSPFEPGLWGDLLNAVGPDLGLAPATRLASMLAIPPQRQVRKLAR